VSRSACIVASRQTVI